MGIPDSFAFSPMDRFSAICPTWLAKLIDEAGGSVGFYEYMDWALNDPQFGAYATGRLRIGKDGDFVTSASLGKDFCELLTIQLVELFRQLQAKIPANQKLTLVEVGPGEADLILDFISSIEKYSPDIFNRLEIVLIELNEGMVTRQKNKLSSVKNVSIRWSNFEELEINPVIGVMIANEVLDALPVERIVFRGDEILREAITLFEKEGNQMITSTTLPLTSSLTRSIEDICVKYDFNIPPKGANDGWTSEWHIELNPWLEKASKALKFGPLLLIDYFLKASRYYSPSRSTGTLLAYRNQKATSDLFLNPGSYDLTSHVCLETLKFYAAENGWSFIGETLQGEALLALGLSGRLYSLQSLPNSELDQALERREALLRLVDPYGLGGFRWIALEKNNSNLNHERLIGFRYRFLEEPTS